MGCSAQIGTARAICIVVSAAAACSRMAARCGFATSPPREPRCTTMVLAAPLP